MIRIGAVQHPSTESLLENFEYIRNYTINAKEAGCSCVCFPECSLTGYFPEKSMKLSISPDDPIIAELSSLPAVRTFPLPMSRTWERSSQLNIRRQCSMQRSSAQAVAISL